MKTTLALFLILLSGFSIYAADDSHRIIAEEFFKVTNMEDTYNKSLETMIDLQTKNNPQLTPLKPVMLAFFNKYVNWSIVKPKLIDLYVKNFTEDELKVYIAFFSTPEGKKWAALQQELFRKGAEVGQELVMAHMPELQEMINAELQKIRNNAKAEPAKEDSKEK